LETLSIQSGNSHSRERQTDEFLLKKADGWMAGLKKYDERLEQLVVETRTAWDPTVGKLEDADRKWLSKAIHNAPELATKIEYQRAHTGFAREITITVEDIQRLYQSRLTEA
jgi:hypothetical protein